MRRTKIATSIHAVRLHLVNVRGECQSKLVGGRASAYICYRKPHELVNIRVHYDANTHLIGEAGPPVSDSNPDLVKHWGISVLRNSEMINARSCEQLVQRTYEAKEIENYAAISRSKEENRQEFCSLHGFPPLQTYWIYADECKLVLVAIE